MSSSLPLLHMICGKIAAGKSTLAAELAQLPGTVVLCEDIWLKRLYPSEMIDVSDYVRCSRRLREVLGPHVVQLLKSGLSVVLDFPANTVSSRRWMRSLFENGQADHVLYFIDISDEDCLNRLRRRNAAGEHEFAASDAEFELITRYFTPPTFDEGFKIVKRS